MSLNVTLLQKVKQHILDEPARLRMDTWLIKGEPDRVKYIQSPGYSEPTSFVLPACGTVGCIAGWAAVLSASKPEEVNSDSYIVRSDTASDILGIDTSFEPFDLFFCDQWPLELREAYFAAANNTERAEIVGRVIDRYILEYNENKKLYDAS